MQSEGRARRGEALHAAEQQCGDQNGIAVERKGMGQHGSGLAQKCGAKEKRRKQQR